MRILLIGEYSRLHNSLKEALIKLGHDVLLVGNGDGFKKYPVDLQINHSFQNKFLKKLKVGFYKLTGVDLASLEIYLKTCYHFKKLKGFDVVQLINEAPFVITPKYEKKIISRLMATNKKVVLLSCGIDHQCMSYMMEDKFRYSIMSPYLKDKSLYDIYKFQLQYLNKDYTDLHTFIYNNCYGVIATDMDYHIPLIGHKKYLGLIPNPININKIKPVKVDATDKIKIFHGVNLGAIHKKGNHFFNDALRVIADKYNDKVEIKTTYNLPYETYIKLYDNCHILLDQVLGYDQGYNALEAMAKGKVVFTGAEKEWLNYYNIEEDTVAINALPDANYIAEKLEWLILNPQKITEIGENARVFVEKEHDYKVVAKKYIETWNSTYK